MKLTLSEIGALAQKAARGAGYPIGLAEDLGRIAVALAGTGNDLSAVADALTIAPQIGTTDWQADGVVIAATDPLTSAAIARDALVMGYQHVVLPSADHAPLGCELARQDGIAVTCADARLTRSGTCAPRAPQGPTGVPDALYHAWNRLAAATYVPATEASRTAGAGAGLTDND